MRNDACGDHGVEFAFTASSESDTGQLARALATVVREQQSRYPGVGLLIYLRGDLGTGKTTLTRALFRALGVKERVKSPTYALLESYSPGVAELRGLRLLHLDLYRLTDAAELEYLGLPEILDGSIALIEWPRRGRGWLPAPDILVEIQTQGEKRDFVLRADRQRGQDLLEKLCQGTCLVSS